MRSLIKICSIFSLTALISCSNSGQSNLTAPSAVPTIAATNAVITSTEVPEETVQPTEIVQSTEAIIPKIKLIDDLTYSGEKKTLTIQGKEYPAMFVEINLHPFGFYIPDTMKEFIYEDGSEVGLNKAEFIGLTEVKRLVNPDNLHESLGFGGDILFSDEDLVQYEEYVGSAGDGGGGPRVDGFVFKQDKAPDMMVYFRYFNRNKETVLPVFLEVARNIKYIES